MFQPARDVDYREAKEVVILWAKQNKLKVGFPWAGSVNFSWARWTYSARPFWSTWVKAMELETFRMHDYGLHIYDDGEVLIVVDTEEDGRGYNDEED